jgi:isoleucyl-tRNA synthetase
MDYKQTLNLPQTDFPMKAQLSEREPQRLKEWETQGLYRKIEEKMKGQPLFLLHDGPPYANGRIHFGHILNKTLKDIIIKYKTMTGFYAPFIPGWDCHGLPIEHQVDKQLGKKKREMSLVEIRRACRTYAAKFVAIQKDEFKRLGIFGQWDHPYQTMDNHYEATIAREFAQFVENGSIYSGKKPVLWCSRCRTALAEAEVEYDNHQSPSIYVSFKLAKDALEKLPELVGREASIVIWTTTPWTLPANFAVACHPNFDYVATEIAGQIYIIAKNCLDSFVKMLGAEDVKILKRFSASVLEKTHCSHPFLDRSSLIVLSDHVTMDTGTGCVHIAPGHGEEDYSVGLKYELPIVTPVDNAGRFTEEVGLKELIGKAVFDSNQRINEILQEKGALLQTSQMDHSYPHCWRCKKPVIFRATEQWFLSMKHADLRGRALDAIRRATWIPDWGRDRIYNMVSSRPDWCLSRQRTWGVPIMAFECDACGHKVLDLEKLRDLATRIDQEGSDFWFDENELLEPSQECPQCHGKKWRRESDILDVWFDSGVSYAAVVEDQLKLTIPVDLYLEGNDQHRGWFHSSLLAAVGTRQKAPYKATLTHGFVVDGAGKKYSKSVGNYQAPDRIISQSGAEILRLWVAAEDYRTNIRFSEQILGGLRDAYRKIRNTYRFLLGNLSDFDPKHDAIAFDDLDEIDRYALHLLQGLVERVRVAYDEYAFHTVFHEINRFCTVDLSSFYLDILKDRLYTTPARGRLRRGSQTVLFELVCTLSVLMAPILVFTAEEVWETIPAFHGKEESVHLTSFPAKQEQWLSESLASTWEILRVVRDNILRALEEKRQAKLIGNALEARVFLYSSGDLADLLKDYENDLADLFIVSQVEILSMEPEDAVSAHSLNELSILIQKAEGEKCERCWKWATTVGDFSDHPTVCHQCHKSLTCS